MTDTVTVFMVTPLAYTIVQNSSFLSPQILIVSHSRTVTILNFVSFRVWFDPLIIPKESPVLALV